MRLERSSRWSKSLALVAASTRGLSHRFMREVMVCLMEANVLSEAEQKSLSALTAPGDSASLPPARASMIAGNLDLGLPLVSWR